MNTPQKVMLSLIVRRVALACGTMATTRFQAFRFFIGGGHQRQMLAREAHRHPVFRHFVGINQSLKYLLGALLREVLIKFRRAYRVGFANDRRGKVWVLRHLRGHAAHCVFVLRLQLVGAGGEMNRKGVGAWRLLSHPLRHRTRARPDSTRSRIIARSNSAISPSIWNIARPAGVEVSSPC